jgi:hypothetical protein
MDYYKFNIKSLFSSLFIITIFMSDFGIVISDQPIYFFQILASIYLTYYIIKKSKIEIGWLLFFAATITSTIFNVSLLFETRQFAGDTYPWTSIKAFINILLFYAVFKTTKLSYQKINPNLFLYLSIFMILYGFIELLFGSNISVQKILNLFHTNQRAIGGRDHLTLLGREHSYGALGNIVAACIMIYFYNKNIFKGLKSIFVFLCILLLLLLAILAKSKSGYLSMSFLGIFYLICKIKGKKKNLRDFFLFTLIGFSILVLSINFINYGWFQDIKASITGSIGSGSTYTRWVSLVVSYGIFIDNIFWGVGPGNFKLFYVDYVYLYNFPIVLELLYWTDPQLTRGSIDSLNYFAGILSEFGIVTFIIVFFIIFKRIYLLFANTNLHLKNISLALLISPVIFGASLGFYYWAVPFFPFFLAILNLDYEKYKSNI